MLERVQIISGLLVLSGERWKGCDLGPQLGLCFSTGSRDHNPQPGARLFQSFCSVFLVEITDVVPRVRHAVFVENSSFFILMLILMNEIKRSQVISGLTISLSLFSLFQSSLEKLPYRFLVGLEPALYTTLALNFHQPSCLCVSNAGNMGA